MPFSNGIKSCIIFWQVQANVLQCTFWSHQISKNYPFLFWYSFVFIHDVKVQYWIFIIILKQLHDGMSKHFPTWPEGGELNVSSYANKRYLIMPKKHYSYHVIVLSMTFYWLNVYRLAFKSMHIQFSLLHQRTFNFLMFV